jgi:hypothetical protein
MSPLLSFLGPFLLVAGATPALSQDAATPQRLSTRWAAEVDARAPWPEYPRPSLVRGDWLNLNGAWECALPKTTDGDELSFDRRVVVPFAIESALSGVGAHAERVVYRRRFEVPATWSGRRVRLNFGAVDWRARVVVDGREVGVHEGGFDAFGFDLSDALDPARKDHELVVDVFDPTDAGGQPIGKQRVKPGGIWYTAVTGIWQTVWLEPLGDAHVDRLTPVTRIARDGRPASLTLSAEVDGWRSGDELEVEAPALGRKVRVAATVAALELGDAAAWSPANPALHGLRVRLVDTNGAILDRVSSYCGFRDIAVLPDARGVRRIALNGAPLFQFGPLDQGFWPDGLYTAPSSTRCASTSTPCAAWAATCCASTSRSSPSSSTGCATRSACWCGRTCRAAIAAGRLALELRAPSCASSCATARHHPSIVMWVPFNEGWGQHDTERITRLTANLDPTRLVNDASGWTDMRRRRRDRLPPLPGSRRMIAAGRLRVERARRVRRHRTAREGPSLARAIRGATATRRERGDAE